VSLDLVSDQEEVDIGEDGGERNGFVAISNGVTSLKPRGVSAMLSS